MCNGAKTTIHKNCMYGKFITHLKKILFIKYFICFKSGNTKYFFILLYNKFTVLSFAGTGCRALFGKGVAFSGLLFQKNFSQNRLYRLDKNKIFS
jgi:hypothetical protein